jgi:hypothetical protein
METMHVISPQGTEGKGHQGHRVFLQPKHTSVQGI